MVYRNLAIHFDQYTHVIVVYVPQPSQIFMSTLFNWHFTQFSNTLRPRQNGRHFADDIFKCILLIENVWIPIKISLKFVPKGPINNILALVQIIAWRRPGDNPLSEPMMVRLPTHIRVTRPQWVNINECLRIPTIRTSNLLDYSKRKSNA